MADRSAEEQAARHDVATLRTHHWASARPHLRLRLVPSPSGAPPRFRPVLEVGTALVAVDPAMTAAWGRVPDELHDRALAGAAAALTILHSVEVADGPAGGARLTVAAGGAGTAALATEPGRIKGALPPGPPPTAWLACCPGDGVVAVAVPQRPTTAGFPELARRLHLLVAGSGAAGAEAPVLRCWAGRRLAIFDHEGP
ncbi:MAG: hypothetical protein AAGK32_14585 [Actinomycetota bacterium]